MMMEISSFTNPDEIKFVNANCFCAMAFFDSIAVQLINIFLTRYDDDMAFKKEMTQEQIENDRKKDEQMFRLELR